MHRMEDYVYLCTSSWGDPRWKSQPPGEGSSMRDAKNEKSVAQKESLYGRTETSDAVFRFLAAAHMT